MVFEVEEAVALEYEVIKDMIEDNCANDVIPLPNVTNKILSKVIEYCKKHVDVEMQKPGDDEDSDDSDWGDWDDDLKCRDADFVKVDQPTLIDIILAANYLSIGSLLDLTCQAVADMVKGMTPEEIRKTYNVGTDFSPEVEEDMRRENLLAFMLL